MLHRSSSSLVQPDSAPMAAAIMATPSDNRMAATVPLLGGHSVSAEVADQAADWLTILMSEDVSEQDRLDWQQWRGLHADNELAWRHIEAVTGRLRTLGPQTGYQVLSAMAEPPSSSRRRLFGALGILASTAMTATLVRRTELWQAQVADLQTGTGEQRQFRLPDGTSLQLNTATALNQLFDQQQRLLQLVRGEVQIHTGHAPGEQRPFMVRTAQGLIRALGTQFSVRSWGDGQTYVAVQDGAVEITPHYSSQSAVINPGQQLRFDEVRTFAVGAADANELAWTQGQLIAEAMPLGQFLARLARHRPGIVRCDPSVAQLRLSGVYPLSDTDRILSTLHNVLPVQVIARTRYWVSVMPVEA